MGKTFEDRIPTEYMDRFQRFLYFLTRKHLLDWMPDRIYLKVKYFACIGEKLNLNDPKTFNEKLQWLKLYNRKNEYTTMVDKYAMREYIKQTVGEQYLIPLIGVYENVDEIKFDELPNSFVLKCTHDSGGVIICKDKTKLCIDETKNKLRMHLNKSFYKEHREWPYKNIKPRIIAEEYVVDESGIELKDYKFFCFNGEAPYLFIATDRPNDTRFDFFDSSFTHLDIINGHPNADHDICKPVNFDKMLEIAKYLSNGFPHIRVDMYNVNGKIYIGELTFFHWSGFVPFQPKEWDYEFGKHIKLPEKQ